MRFEGIKVPIKIKTWDVLRVDPPDAEGGPYLLSAKFTDKKGKNSLTIYRNEWQALTSNWDIVVEGRSITIREDLKKVHLVMTYEEPSTLMIPQLNMSYIGVDLTVDSNGIHILPPDKQLRSFRNFVIRTNPDQYQVIGFNVPLNEYEW